MKMRADPRKEENTTPRPLAISCSWTALLRSLRQRPITAFSMPRPTTASAERVAASLNCCEALPTTFAFSKARLVRMALATVAAAEMAMQIAAAIPIARIEQEEDAEEQETPRHVQSGHRALAGHELTKAVEITQELRMRRSGAARRLPDHDLEQPVCEPALNPGGRPNQKRAAHPLEDALGPRRRS